MTYSVQQRAEYVGTFRWIEINLMETLAAWIPTTPEMEIKILFGRHVWDCAQHADAMGRRAFELRAPLHYTLPPLEGLRAYLGRASKATDTAHRVGLFYGVIQPFLAERYREYIEHTDALLDEPTTRAMETILRDYDRMTSEKRRLAAGVVALHDGIVREELSSIHSIGAIVDHGPIGKRARGQG